MSGTSANVLTLGKTPATTVLKLSWPTILEQIAFTVLNFADTAMVGVLGASFTAAVGITSPVLWLIGGIMSAVSVGFSVQVAQSIGAGEMRRASRAAGQAVITSVATGTLLTVACLLIAPVLPAMLGAEEAIRPHATSYFMVMAFFGLVNSLEMIMSSILRCTGNTKAPLIANSLSIVLNIVLNYLFIYPTRTITVLGNSFVMWGAGMGVAGAALGSVLSILVAALLLIRPFISGERGILFEKSDFVSADKAILTRAVELGMPVALERVTMSLGQVVYMRIISGMGTIAIAAHHLAVQAESLSYLPSFGFAVAATTLVGQSVGANDRPLARTFGRTSSNMAAICMALTGVLLFLLAEPIISIFTRDVSVIALGGVLLRIVAFAQPSQAHATVYAGSLRGAGDSRWPFYINLVGVWGFRVALTLIFVYGLGWGLEAAWIAMLADLVFRGIVCRKRFLRKLS